MRRSFYSALVLVSELAAPALAQQAVSAQPQTFVTWNNRMAAEQVGPAIGYAGDTNVYAPAHLVRGVPNNYMS